MSVKHLLIFIIANCSIFPAGANNSCKTLLLKEGQSPINCHALTALSSGTSKIGATHHHYPHTHIEKNIIELSDNDNSIFGNYLFDVDIQINSGEYEKYVLTDDKSNDIIMIQRYRIDPVPWCAWV